MKNNNKLFLKLVLINDDIAIDFSKQSQYTILMNILFIHKLQILLTFTVNEILSEIMLKSMPFQREVLCKN